MGPCWGQGCVLIQDLPSVSGPGLGRISMDVGAIGVPGTASVSPGGSFTGREERSAVSDWYSSKKMQSVSRHPALIFYTIYGFYTIFTFYISTSAGKLHGNPETHGSHGPTMKLESGKFLRM